MPFFDWLFGRRRLQDQAWPEPARPTPKSHVPRTALDLRPDTAASDWDAARPDRDEIARPEGFVTFDDLTDVKVAGLRHRDHAAGFIRQARAAWRGGRGWPSLRLEREPDNPHGKNAIRVLGRVPGHRDEVHVGYIPSDVSGRIAERFDPAMPLAALLRAVGDNPGGGMFVAIEILVPKAKDRKAFER